MARSPDHLILFGRSALIRRRSTIRAARRGCGLEAGALIRAVLGQSEGAVGAVRAHGLQAPVLRGGRGTGEVPLSVGVGHIPGLGTQMAAEKRVGLACSILDRLLEALHQISYVCHPERSEGSDSSSLRSRRRYSGFPPSLESRSRLGGGFGASATSE